MDHPNVNRRHHLEQLAGLIAAASATSLLVPSSKAVRSRDWTPNVALEWPAGSHSLAAAGQRAR
jgi:hypothetical protein